MSPSAALRAVLPAKIALAAIPEMVQDRCMMLFARNAADPARFLLNPERIVRFIAVIVLQTIEDNFPPKRTAGICRRSFCFPKDEPKKGTAELLGQFRCTFFILEKIRLC